MVSRNGNSRGVGYKNPPAHSRFVKGKSGNPKGRPKGAGMGNPIANVMNRHVTVTLDGVTRKVPLTEALVMSLVQRALNGNTAAAREVLKTAEKVIAEQKANDERPLPIGKVIFATEPPRRDCNAALKRLEVIEPAGPRWCVRPWVIEAALARNDQLVLDENDRQLIADNMVDPETLPQLLLRSG